MVNWTEVGDGRDLSFKVQGTEESNPIRVRDCWVDRQRSKKMGTNEGLLTSSHQRPFISLVIERNESTVERVWKHQHAEDGRFYIKMCSLRESSILTCKITFWWFFCHMDLLLFLNHSKYTSTLGFCICCSLCLEYSSPQIFTRLTSLLQVFTQMPPPYSLLPFLDLFSSPAFMSGWYVTHVVILH